MGTFVVGAIVLAIVGSIIARLATAKRRGKSACDGCDACGGAACRAGRKE
jgi:hypothetical protein